VTDQAAGLVTKADQDRIRQEQIRALDLVVARVLSRGTLLAIVLLAIGVGLMAVNGISPLDAWPPLDLRQIPADILALKPAGFLWLGLVAIILTPITRVSASLVGYVRAGDRAMVLISLGILGVIAASVVISAAVT